MFGVLLIGNALWVYYGFAKSDLPIIATNILSVILDIVMLLLRFKYQRSKTYRLSLFTTHCSPLPFSLLRLLHLRYQLLNCRRLSVELG
jgi:hypothetical protein